MFSKGYDKYERAAIPLSHFIFYTLGNENQGRMVLIGVAQGILLEFSDRFPIIYTRTDHKETLPWIWREVFKEEFENFNRQRYDRYGNSRS